MMNEVYHIPAMLKETVEGLNIRPEGVYVDVTFGGGGHSLAILKKMLKNDELNRPEGLNDELKIGKLYSFDQDIEAYENAKVNRPELVGNEHWQFVHSNFRYLKNFMDFYGVDHIDGLLADLGVSFHHFDAAERGFSFRFDGPLDMRMNREGGRTAAHIVNTYSEEELAKVLYLYGELKNSRSIARRIVGSRGVEGRGVGSRGVGLQTINELVEAVIGKKAEEANPMEKKTLTLVFQALRIEVNDELGALKQMLCAARDLLAPGGRLVVLTYHSLEDRIVKNFLRSGNLEGEIEKDFYGNILTPFKLIEKGRVADAEEVERNPRSRSAKLRVAEKV